MKFYKLTPTWQSRPELEILAHGLVACPKYLQADDWGLEGDPDLSDLPSDAQILMRTGPFIPSLAMASARILYCSERFVTCFATAFPDVTFDLFPKGRIVELDWQSWAEDEFPDWKNEMEGYIIENPHSESLSQKVGAFYRISIPVGAHVSYFQVAPENRVGMSEVLKKKGTASWEKYCAVDMKTWSGKHIFTAPNEVIFLSEVGVKFFQECDLDNLFKFEECLDKDTWFDKRIEEK